MVPPRGRMPRVDSTVSSSWAFSSGPRQPSRKPRMACPWWSMPLRTIARITAFRPGQSPPPVSTPMRIFFATYPGCAMALLLVAAALAAGAAGCGSGAKKDDRAHGSTLTIYTSLPRHGVSARQADAVAAGERLALADSGGRAGGRRLRLVELDDSAPAGGVVWHAGMVEANARRAAED